MTNKTKLTAMRLLIEAAGVLTVAIYVVANYREKIVAIDWQLVSFICVAVAALAGIYRWQTQPASVNSYDVLDMFMKDGKADLQSHLIIASFGLAVWVVVQQALAKQPVTELLLGVLGIFVAGKAAAGFSDAIKNRPASPPGGGDVNVLQGASVTPASPPKPEPIAEGYHG